MTSFNLSLSVYLVVTFYEESTKAQKYNVAP